MIQWDEAAATIYNASDAVMFPGLDAWARPEFSIDAAELRLPASGGGLRLPASAWGHTYLDTRTALLGTSSRLCSGGA